MSDDTNKAEHVETRRYLIRVGCFVDAIECTIVFVKVRGLDIVTI